MQAGVLTMAMPTRPSGGVAWNPMCWWRRPMRAIVACVALGAMAFGSAWASDVPDAGDGTQTTSEVRTVEQWFTRLRGAETIPRYVGTYVVTSINGSFSSAKIWHQAENGTDWERVDVLTGRPVTVYRHDDQTVVLMPGAKHARSVPRHARRNFPNLGSDAAAKEIAEFYTVSTQGEGRVAGLNADVVTFVPRDKWRYAYRVWSEKNTGLMLKSQVIDARGQVLEQAAFSELNMAPSNAALEQGLGDPGAEDFAPKPTSRERADPAKLGWSMGADALGFEPLDFYQKSGVGGTSMAHWIFSDGLTTVSLFIAPYDAARDKHAGKGSFGATHVLRQRWPDATGAWWVAAVGEVPERTLQRFVDNLRYTAP